MGSPALFMDLSCTWLSFHDYCTKHFNLVDKNKRLEALGCCWVFFPRIWLVPHHYLALQVLIQMMIIVLKEFHGHLLVVAMPPTVKGCCQLVSWFLVGMDRGINHFCTCLAENIKNYIYNFINKCVCSQSCGRAGLHHANIASTKKEPPLATQNVPAHPMCHFLASHILLPFKLELVKVWTFSNTT